MRWRRSLRRGRRYNKQADLCVKHNRRGFPRQPWIFFPKRDTLRLTLGKVDDWIAFIVHVRNMKEMWLSKTHEWGRYDRKVRFLFWMCWDVSVDYVMKSTGKRRKGELGGWTINIKHKWWAVDITNAIGYHNPTNWRYRCMHIERHMCYNTWHTPNILGMITL